jgi:hypothetical protein
LEKERISLLSATALQADLSGFVQRWHTYELLIHQGINDQAVVAHIPVAGDPVDVEIHLGRIRVPEQVVDLAGGRTEDAVRRWVEMEVYSATGVWNGEMSLRVMQSLCVDN